MGKEKGRLVGRPFALDIQQRTSQHLVDPSATYQYFGTGTPACGVNQNVSDLHDTVVQPGFFSVPWYEVTYPSRGRFAKKESSTHRLVSPFIWTFSVDPSARRSGVHGLSFVHPSSDLIAAFGAGGGLSSLTHPMKGRTTKSRSITPASTKWSVLATAVPNAFALSAMSAWPKPQMKRSGSQ